MRLLLALLLTVFGALASSFTVSPGQAFDWGFNIPNRSVVLPGITNAIQGSANSDWTLWLKSTGELIAYGVNTYGQTNTPSGTNWTHSAAGWRHGIACDSNGNVDEWGTPFGEDINDWEALRPVALTSDFIIKVAAGDDHSAALGISGTVYIWGGRAACTNQNAVYTDAIDISCGWYNVTILRANGTVVCFGQVSQGGQYFTPPIGLDGVARVNSSQFSQYAVKSNGVVVPWGMPDNFGIMTPPANATNVLWAGGGRDHSVVSRADGTVVVWGDNAQGQQNIPANLTNANFVSSGRFNPIAIQGEIADPEPPVLTQYHVAKTGNDTTGDGSPGNPFLTIQKGVDTATTAGNQVIVHVGDYAEYVASKASGTPASPIQVVAAGDGEASLRSFRINNHTNVTLDGLTFWKSQAGNAGAWSQGVRVEASAHNAIIQSCVFRDTPVLIRTNWSFSGTTNTVYSPSGSDWAAAGFEVGGRIRTGAASIEPYLFVNQDQNYIISGISGDLLSVADFAAETNTAAWSVIYASGSTHTGIRGVELILTGGTAATNVQILNNTFTNIYGFGVDTTGPGPTLIEGNTFDTVAWAAIRYGGHNVTAIRNTFLDNEKWLFYSKREGEDVPHPLGAGAYDFVQGYQRSDGSTGTNALIAFNWFENIHNPFGQIAQAPGFGLNWTIASNVVIGVQKQWDGLGRIGGLVVKNNTFYRVAFDIDSSAIALTQSGTASNPATNQVNMRNAYVDIGHHASTNTEGFYGNLFQSGSTYFGSNFVAGPEPTAWQGKSAFAEIDGVNGGDPLFVNQQNPRGADGAAFTDDDGLRPLPNSPLALLSIGALAPLPTPTTSPIAHFTVRPQTPGWYDSTGTNFDQTWETIPPFSRTNFVRPWNTPDALGEVPAAVFVDARGSLSGSYSTNHWWGINLFQFDWGDGAVDNSWTPTNSHVYLWPGTFTVTLRCRNTFGNWATNSLQYRVKAQSGGTPTVWHVATTGADTNAGTYAAPFLTIAKAVSVVVAGDYIAVQSGDYNEWVEMDRNVATESQRISIHGFGASCGGFQFRHPNWTVWGFDIDATPPGPGSGSYVHQAADNSWMVNNYYHDFGGLLAGAIYSVGSGDQNPLNQNLNSRVIGCTFSNINSPIIQIFGGSNWLVSNFRAFNTTGEGDFIRPRGANHVIQDGYGFNFNSGGGGGHPDFVQLDNQAGDGFWWKDLLIQRVFIEGDTNAAPGTDHALGQIETGAFADDVRYTNMVIRNSIFKNVRGPFSDSNDGFKFVNNLFYRSPREASAVTAGGGVRGSSYGTTFYNNIFYGVGWTDSDTVGWYYTAQSGSQASNTTVIADWNHVAGILGGDKSVALFTYNGQEANGINVDGEHPRFIGESIGDYRLTTNSLSYLGGTNLTSAGFLGDNVDFLGNPYPTNGPWSIGPIHLAAEATGAPPPPTDTDPPTPDPMTWASVPAAVDNDSITMTASTATDADTPPVQYYFEETTGNPGGSSSGWISTTTYVDSGLNGSTLYTYRVKARDALGNETGWSTPESATTDPDPPPPAGTTLNATTVIIEL